MKKAEALDRITEHFEEVTLHNEKFAAKFGSNAAGFLPHLAPLFRLFRRVPLDDRFPLRARHYSALVAYYLAEHQDYLDDHSANEVGLVDDIYVAFLGLKTVTDLAGEDLVREHWRGDGELSDVLGLALNLDLIKDALPSKVLERLEPLMRLPG